MGIHYGFFTPWTQQLGWRNWQQPWFMDDETEDMIRYYARLRSSLFPYIYTAAHDAATKALPIARSLSLMYPDVPEYDYVANTYMFGPSLLVSVFDMNVTLPEGTWYDFWTGEKYEGGRKIEYTIPEGRGGALFAKAGSVIPMMEAQDYIDKKNPDEYILHVFPGADGTSELYEDDGYSYEYMNGEYATTALTLAEKDGKTVLTVGARNGSYSGMARRPEGEYKESDPEVPGIGEVTPMKVIVHGVCTSVTLDGADVDFTVEGNETVFTLAKERHEAGDAVFTLTLA